MLSYIIGLNREILYLNLLQYSPYFSGYGAGAYNPYYRSGHQNQGRQGKEGGSILEEEEKEEEEGASILAE